MGFEFRTEIPDYLLPLPQILEGTARRNRLSLKIPKTLLEMCADVLARMKPDIRISDPTWSTLSEIFKNDNTVITDSYRLLCHIQNPTAGTEFLVQKADRMGITPYELLVNLKVIRQEAISKTRNEELLSHWDNMRPKKVFPKVLFSSRR